MPEANTNIMTASPDLFQPTFFDHLDSPALERNSERRSRSNYQQQHHTQHLPWFITDSCPDLPGLFCNIGTSLQDTLPPPLLAQKPPTGLFYGPGSISCGIASSGSPCVYPSPPPTNSNPKRSVPLPSITINGPGITSSGYMNSKPSGFGGILDSPLVEYNDALGTQTPPSPPPTIPTPTLELPPPEESEAIEPDNSYEPTLSEGSGSSIQFIPHSDASSQHLLSPLSPEWDHSRITELPISPVGSVLLSGEDPPLSQDTQCCATDPPSAELGILHNLHSATDTSTPLPRPFLSLLRIPDSPYHDSLDLAHLSTPYLRDASELEECMDVDPSPQESGPLLTPDSPPLPSNLRSLPKLDYDSDILLDDTTFPHPTSPSILSTSLPDLGFDDDTPSVHSPSSPSLRTFTSLPESDFSDFPQSPPSSLLSLPGADTDDDLIPAELSLPSYRPDSTSSSPNSSPASTSSLLLIDDAVPARRSPSPEHPDPEPDLDIASFLISHPGEALDPDLERLHLLRIRSLSAERAARQKETQALEQGSVCLRAEARRQKKREKERGREIAALLRLKLGFGNKRGHGVLAEDGDTWTSNEGQLIDADKEMNLDVSFPEGRPKKTKKSKSKGMVGNMAGLVARMMFRRRHENVRPLSTRKPPGSPYIRSNLSQSVLDISSGEVDHDGLHVDQETDMDMQTEELIPGNFEGKIS